MKKILWFREQITAENQTEIMETENETDERQSFKFKSVFTLEDMHVLIDL